MMKFLQTSFLLSTTLLFVSAAPGATRVLRRDVDPPFIDGGEGKCEGSTDPHCCPPTQSLFLAAIDANVKAGHIVNNTDILNVSYPTSGNDRESKIARVKFAMATVANMRGKNDGCPLDTTSLVDQLDALVHSVDRRRDVFGRAPRRGKVQLGELTLTAPFPTSVDGYSETATFIATESPQGLSALSGIPTQTVNQRRDVFGKAPKGGKVQHPGGLSLPDGNVVTPGQSSFFPVTIDTNSFTVTYRATPGVSSPLGTTPPPTSPPTSPPTPPSSSPTIDTNSETVTYYVPTPGVSSPLGTSPPPTSLPTDSMSQVPGFPRYRRRDVVGKSPKRGRVQHPGGLPSFSVTLPPTPPSSSPAIDTNSQTVTYYVPTPGVSSPLGTPPPSTSLPTDSIQVVRVKSSSTPGIFPTQGIYRRLDVFGKTPKRGKVLHRHNSSMSTSKTPTPSFPSVMFSTVTVTDTISLSEIIVSTPGIDPSSTSGIFPTSTPVSDFSTSLTPPPSTSLTISLPTTSPTSTGTFPEIPSDTPSSISTPVPDPSSTPVTEVSSSVSSSTLSTLPVTLTTDPNSQSISMPVTTDSLPTLPSSTPISFTSTPPLPSTSSSAITPLPTESPTTSLPTMTLPSSLSPGPYRRQNVGPIPSASVPALGHISNVNPKATQDGTVCDGYPEEDGTIPPVPCYCPPDFNTFYEALNANFLAGRTLNGTGSTEHTIAFPLDDSKASKLTRLVSAKFTLLNYLGKGEGCPVTSTNFTQQEKFIEGLPDQ